MTKARESIAQHSKRIDRENARAAVMRKNLAAIAAEPKMTRDEVLAAIAKAVVNGSFSPAGATDAIKRYSIYRNRMAPMNRPTLSPAYIEAKCRADQLQAKLEALIARGAQYRAIKRIADKVFAADDRMLKLAVEFALSA